MFGLEMASASIASSPCQMKLQQHLSSSSLSSPNTSANSSSCSSSNTLSPNNNTNLNTTPTHYNPHQAQQHQLQLLHQRHNHHISQQQSHHLHSNNTHMSSMNNSITSSSSTSSLNIKKEPGLISPPTAPVSSLSNENSFVSTTINNNNNIINSSNKELNHMSNPIMLINSPIVSTTSTSVSTANNNEMFNANSKCKRKINFAHLGIPNRGHQPATVARRNARERNRVKQVNNGFAALKQHIPLGHRSKKMSKVETLRCAVDYIKNLKTLLDPNGVAFSAEDGAAAFAALQFDFGMSTGSGGSTQQLSPTSSEEPSSPSYASEGSYVTSNGPNGNNGLYDYENYEPVSPDDDEELLDAISWWQQS